MGVFGGRRVLVDAGEAIRKHPCDDFTSLRRVAGSDSAAARQGTAEGEFVGELQVPAHR